jgi:hypothetical protein
MFPLMCILRCSSPAGDDDAKGDAGTVATDVAMGEDSKLVTLLVWIRAPDAAMAKSDDTTIVSQDLLLASSLFPSFPGFFCSAKALFESVDKEETPIALVAGAIM